MRIFLRELNTLVEEAKLVHDLRRSLGKQIVDVDIVTNMMKTLDNTGEDQLTFDQVESVLDNVNIKLDKMVMTRWMKASRTAAVSSCSITRLVQILHKAANPVHKLYLAGGNYFCAYAQLITLV